MKPQSGIWTACLLIISASLFGTKGQADIEGSYEQRKAEEDSGWHEDSSWYQLTYRSDNVNPTTTDVNINEDDFTWQFGTYRDYTVSSEEDLAPYIAAPVIAIIMALALLIWCLFCRPHPNSVFVVFPAKIKPRRPGHTELYPAIPGSDIPYGTPRAALGLPERMPQAQRRSNQSCRLLLPPYVAYASQSYEQSSCEEVDVPDNIKLVI